MQWFYFSLFTSVFSISLIASNLPKLIKISIKIIYIAAPVCILFAIIIKYNTLVHPYLLADNRHYTFYIWNRFYGKYPFAAYIMIPVYFLSLLNICLILFSKRSRHSINFPLFYILCTTASISLQKLIEIRYFILPFLIFRLLQRHSMPIKYLALEFLLNLALNIITFYMFFTKEIRWNDYSDTQRLIW